MELNQDVREFIKSACTYEVKLLMVGGAAVNFHGYLRQSADVDFWIKLEADNLKRLQHALQKIGYEFQEYPSEVLDGLQNISLKLSPFLEIELITKFQLTKSFDEAYSQSSVVILDEDNCSFHVLNYEDLIDSKIKSGRPKDLLDIQELKRIRNKK